MVSSWFCWGILFILLFLRTLLLLGGWRWLPEIYQGFEVSWMQSTWFRCVFLVGVRQLRCFLLLLFSDLAYGKSKYKINCWPENIKFENVFQLNKSNDFKSFCKIWLKTLIIKKQDCFIRQILIIIFFFLPHLWRFLKIQDVKLSFKNGWEKDINSGEMQYIS